MMEYGSQGDRLMRQPNFVPDHDQLIKDFHGVGVDDLDDVAPDAVTVSVDEYLNPQDVRHGNLSPTDDDLLSSVSNSPYLIDRFICRISFV